jgi:hypothetical protein
MALQRLQIGAGAERLALRIAGDDDHAHRRVAIGFPQDPAVFGVHPPGPGVAALRAREGDDGDAVGHS